MNTLTDNEANAGDDADVMRIRKKLMRLMLGSILITFVLVGLVLAAVIYKIMAQPQQVESADVTPALVQEINLAAGFQLASYHLSGDILIIQAENAAKDNEFILYNIRLQRIVSHLKIKN